MRQKYIKKTLSTLRPQGTGGGRRGGTRARDPEALLRENPPAAPFTITLVRFCQALGLLLMMVLCGT